MGRPVHFEILTDKPEKMADFYKSVFGWKVEPWEGGDDPYLLLSTGSEDEAGIDGAIMGRHFPQAVINTIEIESLDEMLKKVGQAGGKIVQGPNEIPGVGTHAYCQDPDGNLFGMMQPAPDMG